MTFESLKIELDRYGANKGKLIAQITLTGKDARTTLTLPPDVGEKVLQLAKNAIIDAVEQSANDFIFELTTAIPETLNLESKP
jgi:carbon monoxide dehydrogenase subunit G